MARLFHSLVVCGAGLTLLQCGGRYAGREGDDTGEGDGATGQGGSPTSGGSKSTGSGGKSTAGNPAGGSLALGGALTTAGSGPVGGGPVVGPRPVWPNAPTPQWVCFDDLSCSDGAVDLAFASCKEDPSRPTLPTDCPADTVMSCVQGRLDTEVVPFSCECLPRTADGSCSCPSAFNGNCLTRLFPPETCNRFRVDCSCAVTCILK